VVWHLFSVSLERLHLPWTAKAACITGQFNALHLPSEEKLGLATADETSYQFPIAFKKSHAASAPHQLLAELLLKRTTEAEIP